MAASKNKNLTLILDVGSGSVGGALVLLDKKNNGKVKLLYNFRQPIKLLGDWNFDKFLEETINALEIVCKKIESQKIGAPENIHCFLASPWFVTQTRIIKFAKEKPFVITKKIITELSQKEINNFESFYMKDGNYFGESHKIIDQELLEVKLNGYKILNPFDILKKIGQVKSIEMALFLSIAPEKILNQVNNEINKFYSAEIFFSSFLLPSFALSRDMFSDTSSFMLMDIAGEIADVSLIKSDILIQNNSFPLGKNFLISSISKSLGKNLSDSETLLDLYLDNQIEKKLAEKLEIILNSCQKEWVRAFQNSLHNLSNHSISLPSKIIVSADSDVAPWFAKAIKSDHWGQYQLAQEKFDVIMLDEQKLSKLSEVAYGVKKDLFLLLETVYLSRHNN
ncbi:MAG: hypothetical protein US50_C0018G0008 [Candidatus Nomurabacteria bacterium GW2011_GWB1_37_5]|uniref:Cell division protein FtsA n=1 Tax=Candidatus Nomurabacteria bacterium GW2011_GWB1_37_5 TaxID=1618742 RepID=A0A0G0H9W0_9BACT|nr:MAG: hypothetical protein US50_C0018G0008 [Candidatus Nomurabacteria bacterium GW2011_GWB1_37_5]